MTRAEMLASTNVPSSTQPGPGGDQPQQHTEIMDVDIACAVDEGKKWTSAHRNHNED